MLTKYIKGYTSSLNKHELSIFYKKFNKQSIIVSLSYIFIYHSTIFLAIYTLYVAQLSHLLNVVLTILVVVFVTRQQRALENIVHFGSHYNITAHKKLNDFLLNSLCGYFVMQNVRLYRKFHLIHHNRFGSADDPCKTRYELFNDLENNNYFLKLRKNPCLYFKLLQRSRFKHQVNNHIYLIQSCIFHNFFNTYKLAFFNHCNHGL